jgi:hypothetical protein
MRERLRMIAADLAEAYVELGIKPIQFMRTPEVLVGTARPAKVEEQDDVPLNKPGATRRLLAPCLSCTIDRFLTTP